MGKHEIFLPPQDGLDIIGYFASFEGSNRFPGYDACAERLLASLENAVTQSNPRSDEAVCLALRPGFDHEAYQLDGEVPAGSRALIELAYFLTAAEIVGQAEKGDGSISMYLHGIYEGTPVEFMEVYTAMDGVVFMEWTVRADRPAPEMEEKIVQSDLRPMRGEQRELSDITVDEIRRLPDMGRKKWRELAARQKASLNRL